MPPFVKEGVGFELCRDAFNSILKSGAARTGLSFLKEKGLMAFKPFYLLLFQCCSNIFIASLYFFYTKKDKKSL